jgi:hypothetical protein
MNFRKDSVPSPTEIRIASIKKPLIDNYQNVDLGSPPPPTPNQTPTDGVTMPIPIPTTRRKSWLVRLFGKIHF